MEVERWDTCELVMEATGTYANPFTDVSVTGTFTHTSSGRSVVVNGFFDGGPIWRIRFMPVELGEWVYVTQSEDSGLNDQRGVLTCVPPTKDYLHGPLMADGLHFRHADGARRYLISTRFTCQFASPSVWPRIIRFLKHYRINRVLFIMGGRQQTMKDLYGDGPDFSRYNIVRFQAIDAFINTLRQADILASPYFYYFNDGLQHGMMPEHDYAYIRYGMARFGAYANVMPVLCNQVEGKFTYNHLQYNLASHEWANEMGAYMRKQAVFGVPVSVHNPLETENATQPSYYTLLKDWPFPWAQFMLRQGQVSALSAAPALSDSLPEQKTPTYNFRGYSRHNQWLIDLRRFGVPVINEEPGYEMAGRNWNGLLYRRPWNSQSAETLVPTFWTAVTAGAYAMWGHAGTYELDDPFEAMRKSITPERLRILHDFITSVPYWEMEPANECVSPAESVMGGEAFRTNFCLAKPGHTYLIFSLKGGTLTIFLAPGARYNLTRLDPRTGEREALGGLPGASHDVSLLGQEQVLLCQREQ